MCSRTLAVALSGTFVVLPRHLLMPGTASELVSAPAEPPLLTRREREVLMLAAEGYSNRRIAEIMWVAEQSIRFHLSNVFRKLGVTNRTGAIRSAEHYGLIEPRPWPPEPPPDLA
jgi:DNA-binding CsgD family transcriptional regulator